MTIELGDDSGAESVDPTGHADTMQPEDAADEKVDATATSISDLWGSRDYRAWFMADTSMTLSGSVSSFALPLVAQAITGSTALATLTSSISSALSAVLSIPGGVVQDKYDRRKLMILWGLIGCVVYGAFALIGTVGMAGYWTLIVLSIILGIRAGLLATTSNTMLRGIVPDEQLPKALTLNQGRDATVELAGAPISGFLVKVSSWLPFWVVAALNVLTAGSSALIRHYWHRGDHPERQLSEEQEEGAVGTEPSQPTESDEAPPTYRDAFGGIAWLLTDNFQLRALLSSAGAFGCFNALLLITILQMSERGDQVLAGFINTAVAVGILVGSLLTSMLLDRIPGGILMTACYAVMTIGTFGVALIDNDIARFAILGVTMLLLPAGNAVGGGFINLMISKSSMGRVFAGIGLAEGGFSALIVYLAGLGSDNLGYHTTALILAICVPLFASLFLTAKGVLGIPKPGQWNDYIAEQGYKTF